MKLPHCKKPCGNCPFKKSSLKGWLGEERMEEILASDSFVCHKNTALQCGGFMLVKGEESVYVKTSKLLNIDLELKGKDEVFSNKKDCIEHHKNK